MASFAPSRTSEISLTLVSGAVQESWEEGHSCSEEGGWWYQSGKSQSLGYPGAMRLIR